LIEAMRASPCLNLVLPDEERVQLLLEEYDFFVRDAEYFCDRLQVLTEFRGKVLVDAWQASVRAGDIAPVVRELLTQHYDPVYLQSMRRNFKQFENSKTIAPHGYSVGAFGQLAEQILETLAT
jgi:tRNA 2-selenouridine synthase